MLRFFLTTYAPLVSTKAGRLASNQHGIKPFVDGSIRREPDLEHRFPSISCLCRAEKFAPRLEVDDIVAYMTRKGRYGTEFATHRRLTAILRVVEVLSSHTAAAKWYRAKGMKLPSNCVVPGNLPKPLDESHRMFDYNSCAGDRRTQAAWESIYRFRSKNWKCFVICRPLWRDLSWEAPAVEDEHLRKAFGRIPGTQNPGALSVKELKRFVRLVGVPVSLSGL